MEVVRVLELELDAERWPVGSPDVLHAFFSTASVHLEPDGWGSRFPVLMHQLYQGEVDAFDADAALAELRTVRFELLRFGPGDVVWDVDDRRVGPPWGGVLDVSDVTYCFYTADGRPLLDVLKAALGRLRIVGRGTLRIARAESLVAV